METVIGHMIEPEVAGPPPRVARLPPGTSLLLLAAMLLFAVFIYGGSRALLEAWKMAWLGMTGHPVTAHVTQVLTAPSSEKTGSDRQVGLRYAYTLPTGLDRSVQTGVARLEMPEAEEAQRLTGSRPVTRRLGATPAAPVFRIGDPLPLRAATWLGRPLVSPWQGAPTGKIVFLLLCGGLVIGISAVLLRRIARWQGHRLRLLRLGIATTGTITHKEACAEDAPRYYVRYGYAAGNDARESEEQVSMEQWKRLDVGQPVTVLYDPDHVGDAGLYTLIGKG